MHVLHPSGAAWMRAVGASSRCPFRVAMTPERAAGKGPGRVAVDRGMTQPFEIDLHSEYLRADLFLAMGQPSEALKQIQRMQ